MLIMNLLTFDESMEDKRVGRSHMVEEIKIIIRTMILELTSATTRFRKG